MKQLLNGVAMAILLVSTPASGAYITMATDFSVTVTPGGVALVVTAENRGNVSAHAVQFEIILGDRVLGGPVLKPLEAGKKTSADYFLDDLPRLPGRYPVVLKTAYQDSAGHRFSALTVGFYNYQSTVKPTVSIRGQTTEILADGKGRLIFRLRNDGQKQQTIDLALFIPNELSTSAEYPTIKLGPKQEKTLVYDMENDSAVANSSYPVSLVGRYKDAGTHYSAAGSAVVRVAADAISTDRNIWIWIILGGLIPGVMIFLRLQQQ